MYSPEIHDSIRNIIHVAEVMVEMCCMSGQWFGLSSSVCSEINKDGGDEDLHGLLLTVLFYFDIISG